MSRAGALVFVILVLVLTVISTGSALPIGTDSVAAHETGLVTKAVTVRSQEAPSESAWERLRWLFAGVALSNVLLVTRRQYQLFVGHRKHPRRYSGAERHHGQPARPIATMPDKYADVSDRDWLNQPPVPITFD